MKAWALKHPRKRGRTILWVDLHGSLSRRRGRWNMHSLTDPGVPVKNSCLLGAFKWFFWTIIKLPLGPGSDWSSATGGPKDPDPRHHRVPVEGLAIPSEAAAIPRSRPDLRQSPDVMCWQVSTYPPDLSP